MILSHERLPGDNDGNIIRYELIDAISTIALKCILVSRINKIETIYSQCIKDIWFHLQLIANNFPRYKAAIAGLDFELDTG